MSDWIERLECRKLLASLSVSYSASVPVQTTDYTAPLSLPKFNPSLGTLTEVDLAFSTSGMTGGTVTNRGVSPETFSFTETVDLALADLSTTLLTPELTASQTFTDLAGGAAGQLGPFNPTQSNSATYTSGATFDEFAGGPGNVTLTIQTNTNQSVNGGGGNIESDVTTTAGGVATVTYQYTPFPVTLSGHVYDDAKGTGSLEAGDPPIPGTTLDLFDSTGTIVATTATGADGSYSFTTTAGGGPLEPGTYSIAEVQPAGYLQGSNTVGTVNGATNGTLSSLDVIGAIGLTSGQASIDNNFGEILPVTVSGTVYDDVKGTGSLVAGDTPIAGVTVQLFNAGGLAATTTTNAFGTYSFTTNASGQLLPPATYTLVETQPAGYLQGSNTVGTVNGVTVGTLPATDVIGAIGLTQGQASINNNFGEILPVTVSGTVYDDVKGTGSLVAGDTPIAGVTVQLFNAGGLVATTTTNAFGTYAFTTTASGGLLPPNTYTLAEVQPAGYLQGSNTVGTVNGVTVGTLPATDVIGSIALTSGQASINNNFGEVLPVTVSGTVYDDHFHAGALLPGDTPIAGVTVQLFNAGGLVATTTTNAFGAYSFTTTASGSLLPPATYTLVETQPAGYLQGSNTVGTVNGVTVGTLPATDVIGSIALTSGQASINNNFGEVLPVTVSGTVYDDHFHAGALLPGDTPIAGVTVQLFNAGGLVATTTTNAFGAYSFTTTASGSLLPPATYTLVETQPAGYLQGSNTVGTVNGVTVGTLPATDVIGSIALAQGQSSINNNFGEIAESLNVTNVERFGVHLQPTLIVLTFDTPLNPLTAQFVGNYEIFGPTDSKKVSKIPIESATYNASSNTVTLRLGERLNVHHPYQLIVNGLVNTLGGALVGSNGLAGSSYITTLNRTDLSGFTDIYGTFVPINHGKLYPAAISSGYQLKPFTTPTNLGSFASANQATFLAATAGAPEAAPITHLGKRKLPSTHNH